MACASDNKTAGNASEEEYMESSPQAHPERVSIAHPSSGIEYVSMRMPPFWPEKPAIWFAQLEGQFVLCNIKKDITKFYYVIGQLDHQTSAEVEDIIVNPPEHEKYNKLKAELIKRLTASKEKMVKQLLVHEELGDRKPSQFLRHLQHLAGPQVPEDFLRTIWSSRLPNSTQTIIASQRSVSLQELADLADRIHDVVPPSSQIASTSLTTPTAMETMSRQISELSRQMTALTQKVDRRSRSRTPKRNFRRSRSKSRRSNSHHKKFPTCWYHYKFGAKAEKCIKPCDFGQENWRSSQ